MEKLTLENIASYLPYGLKFDHYDYNREIKSICSISSLREDECTLSNNEYDYDEYIKDIEPILRPMDLTKPIIVEGNQVIPIVELAKISFPDLNWKLGGEQTAMAEMYSDKVSFWFSVSGKCFCNNWKTYTANQLALFKWLYANKFDVEGLIDAGLAIDVNTLESNPYNS